MASYEVSKKVSLVGSWNEDIVTDDIVTSIIARVKTEKGKKVKVTLNETGVKLTRSRFFRESKTTFFPIKDLRTLTRSRELPQCLLFILLGAEKKYKIIALRCATEDDAVQLTDVFAEIQQKLQSTNMELKKKENGNWTLRERRGQNRRLTDVFSEHKSNGEVTVTANGNIIHSPAPSGNEVHTSTIYHKGVYMKRSNRGSGGSNKVTRKKAEGGGADGADEYVIETEVLPHPHTTTEIHTRHNSDDTRRLRTRAEHSTLTDHKDSSRRQEPGRPQMYSGQHTLPSRGVVYTSTSRTVVPSQPVYYREPPRTYEARMEPPAGYYTNSMTVRGRTSVESEVIPVRVGGDKWYVKLDQRSLRSNTSKASQSRRKRSSDFYVPTTVVRAIEDTYRRPNVIFRQSPEQIVGYTVRPATYRVMGTTELRMYPEDDIDARMSHR